MEFVGFIFLLLLLALCDLAAHLAKGTMIADLRQPNHMVSEVFQPDLLIVNILVTPDLLVEVALVFNLPLVPIAGEQGVDGPADHMESGPDKGLQRVKEHVNMEPGLTMIDLTNFEFIVPELLLALALPQRPKRNSQHPKELDDGANPADGLLLAL